MSGETDMITKKPWFQFYHRNGWRGTGWKPVSWEGYLLFLIYLAAWAGSNFIYGRDVGLVVGIGGGLVVAFIAFLTSSYDSYL